MCLYIIIEFFFSASSSLGYFLMSEVLYFGIDGLTRLTRIVAAEWERDYFCSAHFPCLLSAAIPSYILKKWNRTLTQTHVRFFRNKFEDIVYVSLVTQFT